MTRSKYLHSVSRAARHYNDHISRSYIMWYDQWEQLIYCVYELCYSCKVANYEAWAIKAVFHCEKRSPHWRVAGPMFDRSQWMPSGSTYRPYSTIDTTLSLGPCSTARALGTLWPWHKALKLPPRQSELSQSLGRSLWQLMLRCTWCHITVVTPAGRVLWLFEADCHRVVRFEPQS
jgi:hypothetical protein